jgi:exonuclease VII small subunit
MTEHANKMAENLRRRWHGLRRSSRNLNRRPPLEQSLKLFEEGIRLMRICNAPLEEAERKVEICSRIKSGNMIAKPFEEEE